MACCSLCIGKAPEPRLPPCFGPIVCIYKGVSIISGTGAAICIAVICSSEMRRYMIILAYLGSQYIKFHAARRKFRSSSYVLLLGVVYLA
jgi:hypothetical protein